jgi:hypothetical protein
MTNGLLFMGGVLVLVTVVAVLDWFGRRKHRQHEG